MSMSVPRRSTWFPTHPELIDAAFVAVLMLLGLIGLGSVYGGEAYLVVGAFGIVLGILIGFAGVRLAAPWVFLSLAVLMCYFLLAGAVALRGNGGGILPDATTIRSLADVVLNGWRQLISVVPPVGSSGPLLALPYLMGLVGSVVSYSLARRTAAAWAPLIPLLAVLAVSILLGGVEPFSVVLQGALYFGVAALYLSLRARRGDDIVHRVGKSRLMAPIAVLAVAGLAGLVLAPALAFAGQGDRVVLRQTVVPPFDPHEWVSPLAQLRHWKSQGDAGLNDKVLFTLSPAPTAVVRIATMDAYDGTVYNVAGDPGPPRPGVDASASGWFQPVGDSFAVDAATAAESATSYSVTTNHYGGIWLPTVGTPTSIRFSDSSAASLGSTLRYNSSTASAVAGISSQPNRGGLGQSDLADSYTMTTVVRPLDIAGGDGVVGADVAADPQISLAGPLGVSVPAPSGPSIKGLADILAKIPGATGTPYTRASAIAEFMASQSLSETATGSQPSVPGHSVGRLAQLSATQPWVGNAEQFAAMMALLLTSGSKDPVPARVVLGVRHVREGGDVIGKDITAWVEVGIEGYGWVPFFPTPSKANTKKQNVGKTSSLPDPPPPPVSPRLKSAVAGSEAGPTDSSAQNDNTPATELNPWVVLLLKVAAVMAVPLVLLGIPMGALLYIKSRRRRRRQAAEATSARIAGGWDEVVDWARDTGRDLPGRGTRAETAGALALAEPSVDVTPLASHADRAVFAPEAPSAADAEAYWSDVETARARLVDGLPRWRRLWAHVNPASLRRGDRGGSA